MARFNRIFREISRGWQRPKLRPDCFSPEWPLAEQRSPKSFFFPLPHPRPLLVSVQMSSSLPINQGPDLTAPTPQNTPLQHAPITAGLSRPTVPDITESDEPEEDGPDTTDLRGALAGLVHDRLAGLLGKSSGYIASLPEEVKRSLEGLKGLQVQQTALQNKYKMECLELEKKVCLCDYRFFFFSFSPDNGCVFFAFGLLGSISRFVSLVATLPCVLFGGSADWFADRRLLWQYLDLNKPLYERRLAIIDGSAKPTPEEIQAGEEQSLKDDPLYQKLSADSSDTAPIPEFWLTALRNHVGASEIITDRDAGALKHLTDIRVAYTAPKPGFKLTFFFTPNEFFENDILEKTYYYQEEVGYSGDFVYDHAIGTTIKWKEDKDLTKEFEIKKQRNKSASGLPPLTLVP
jgi:nucleosome assembly protein 1-like 1